LELVVREIIVQFKITRPDDQLCSQLFLTTTMTETATTSTFDPETETPLTLLFSDLERELATTRRVLERVPDGNDEWRPHEKSMTLGGLATHLAQLPGFGILILTTDEFDGATRGPEPRPANNAERLKIFDEVAGKLVPVVQKLTWDQLKTPWKLRAGDRVILNAPRGELFRSAGITHLAHHRAQLGVYLRLLGVPIPGSYGPSADEPVPPRR
jgi:uncharacterized damage-inducible protein DinB